MPSSEGWPWKAFPARAFTPGQALGVGHDGMGGPRRVRLTPSCSSGPSIPTCPPPQASPFTIWFLVDWLTLQFLVGNRSMRVLTGVVDNVNILIAECFWRATCRWMHACVGFNQIGFPRCIKSLSAAYSSHFVAYEWHLTAVGNRDGQFFHALVFGGRLLGTTSNWKSSLGGLSLFVKM
jgi:hypothetical protein